MSDNRITILVEPRLLGCCGSGLVAVTFGEDIASNPGQSGPEICYCGDPDPAGCMHFQAGYPWCRPCGEHHRPPECAIDEQGRALNWEGVPWEDLP